MTPIVESMPREQRDYAEAALARGWRITRTRSGHWCWLAPRGKSVIFSAGTPSDWRAVANLRARLRRAGLDC